MTLAALIKKGGLSSLATATPATLATLDTGNTVTVASVATVAVAEKPEPLSNLSVDEASSIRAWLALIGETGETTTTELINRCRNDMQIRCYLLKRSGEVPDPSVFPRMVTCKDCNHFERIDHPHLGHCSQGEPEAIAGLWDDDDRLCNQFFPFLKANGEHHG